MSISNNTKYLYHSLALYGDFGYLMHTHILYKMTHYINIFWKEKICNWRNNILNLPLISMPHFPFAEVSPGQ